MKIAGMSTKLSKITTELALILGLIDYVSFVVLFFFGGGGDILLFIYFECTPSFITPYSSLTSAWKTLIC